tara:strand:- start:1422 stop:1658 length:237 start_codon:yes stop_codon:yes gene_type:complete
MTMTPEELLKNFKEQQATVAEELRKLDTELAKQKELYVKLQGAIEGLTILAPEEEKTEETATETEPEASPEAVAEVLN